MRFEPQLLPIPLVHPRASAPYQTQAAKGVKALGHCQQCSQMNGTATQPVPRGRSQLFGACTFEPGSFRSNHHPRCNALSLPLQVFTCLSCRRHKPCTKHEFQVPRRKKNTILHLPCVHVRVEGQGSGLFGRYKQSSTQACGGRGPCGVLACPLSHLTLSAPQTCQGSVLAYTLPHSRPDQGPDQGPFTVYALCSYTCCPQCRGTVRGTCITGLNHAQRA